MGRKAFVMEVDVSVEDQVIRFVQLPLAELGCIDIFVSNAGIIEWEPVTKITLECWNRILAVNLTGAMLSAREVAKHMVERRKGVMLFTSSTIQFNPAYKEAAYRVSKTGVQVFAETAAIELAPYGIRVNTVSPGSDQLAELGQRGFAEGGRRSQNRGRFHGQYPPRPAWAAG